MKTIPLNFSNISNPVEIEEIINNSLKTPDNFKGMNYLSIGSSNFPFSDLYIKDFILSFGLDEDTVITNISNAIGIELFSDDDFTLSNIIGNNSDMVISSRKLFTKNPIRLNRLFKDGRISNIDSVGGITNAKLKSLPDYFGHEMHHQEILFRKIIQDIVLLAFEERAKNVSIFYNNNTFNTVVAASLYSQTHPSPFNKKSVFLEFTKYVKSISSKSDHGDNLIYFELNDRKVSIVIEINEVDFSITFELFYRSKFRNTSFNKYTLPEISTMFSGINLINYTNSNLEGFILSQLKSTLSYSNKENVLFVYDSASDMSIFPFKLSINDLHNNSIKIAQADMLVCSITKQSSYDSLKLIANNSTPMVLLWNAQNPISALKKIVAVDPFIANQIRTVSQLYLHPSLCQYCASKKILTQPIKISQPHHPITYINDGTLVNTRNHSGCNKCSFGIASETCFGDMLSVSPNLLYNIINLNVIEYTLLQKLNPLEYRDCISDKLDDIADMLIDPNDIATF